LPPLTGESGSASEYSVFCVESLMLTGSTEENVNVAELKLFDDQTLVSGILAFMRIFAEVLKSCYSRKTCAACMRFAVLILFAVCYASFGYTCG